MYLDPGSLRHRVHGKDERPGHGPLGNAVLNAVGARLVVTAAAEQYVVLVDDRDVTLPPGNRPYPETPDVQGAARVSLAKNSSGGGAT
jgi:hypothetical protein